MQRGHKRTAGACCPSPSALKGRWICNGTVDMCKNLKGGMSYRGRAVAPEIGCCGGVGLRNRKIGTVLSCWVFRLPQAALLSLLGLRRMPHRAPLLSRRLLCSRSRLHRAAVQNRRSLSASRSARTRAHMPRGPLSPHASLPRASPPCPLPAPRRPWRPRGRPWRPPPRARSS